MFNPATWMQTTHMIVAAYMVAGFLMASWYAAAQLRGRTTPYHRRAMALGLVLGCLCAPLQAFVGDRIAKMVAETQPIKLAAMEGQFETETSAPLRIGGLPDEAARATPYALEIPYLLSFLAYGDPNAEVAGLNAFPEDHWPPVAVVHVAFQIMVGIGGFLIALAVWTAGAWWRERGIPRARPFLWAVVASGPLAWIALEAGWVVTEVGRQPWIVQGYMRTADAVTDAPGIWWVFAATIGIYVVLTAGIFTVLWVLARQPLPEAVERGA